MGVGGGWTFFMLDGSGWRYALGGGEGGIFWLGGVGWRYILAGWGWVDIF